MNGRRDLIIRPVPILDLKPTQITVGMREVKRKRKSWHNKDSGRQAEDLAKHMVPVVLGPGGERYITDHHHLARALHDDGQTEVFVTVIGDLAKADPDRFWNLMEYHGWTHPYDEKGRRREYDEIPNTVAGLRDDPYRALAGALRNAGGYAKDVTPYSEFVWADFFRPRISAKAMDKDFDAALQDALTRAKSADADYLPGWSGPHAPADPPAPSLEKPTNDDTEENAAKKKKKKS